MNRDQFAKEVAKQAGTLALAAEIFTNGRGDTRTQRLVMDECLRKLNDLMNSPLGEAFTE